MEGDLEDDEDEDEDNLRRGTMRLRGANLGRRSCLALTLSGVRSRGLSHGSAEQDTTVRFSRRSSTPLAGALWRVHLWRVRRRLAQQVSSPQLGHDDLALGSSTLLQLRHGGV